MTTKPMISNGLSGTDGITFHEIGLLNTHQVNEIKKQNTEFEVMRKKCKLAPQVKEVDINDLTSSCILSPDRTSNGNTDKNNIENINPRRTLFNDIGNEDNN